MNEDSTLIFIRCFLDVEVLKLFIEFDILELVNAIHQHSHDTFLRLVNLVLRHRIGSLCPGVRGGFWLGDLLVLGSWVGCVDLGIFYSKIPNEVNVYLLRGRTHVSRGGRNMRRRLSRSLCVEFFLLHRVWSISYIFSYIFHTDTTYIYIISLLLYTLLSLVVPTYFVMS